MEQENTNQDKVTVTVVATVDLWKAVRNLSTETRRTQQSIWIEAMQAYLERKAGTDPLWCYLCDRPKNDCACVPA